MTTTTDTTAARIAAIEDRRTAETGQLGADIDWLIAELGAYRTELERIAACEPAHRDRVRAVLGSGEVV